MHKADEGTPSDVLDSPLLFGVWKTESNPSSGENIGEHDCHNITVTYKIENNGNI